MFIDNELRIIDENYNFQEGHKEAVNKIVLNDEIEQTIVSNEAIAETHASVKDVNISGVLKIEDFHECVPTSNSMGSMNWNNNTELAEEAAKVLDLVKEVVSKMKGFNEGNIVLSTDCRKA